MLRTQHVHRPRPRRRSTTLLRWLLLFGLAAYGVVLFSHIHISGPSSNKDDTAASGGTDVCAARMAAVGLAPAGSSRSTNGQLRLVPSGATAHVTAATSARRILYDAMSRQLDTSGLHVGAVATQGLQQSSLFRVGEHGALTPILKRLDIPVRAIIAPFSDAAISARLTAAVQSTLAPVMALGGMWPQDSKMYHSTLWHASHHQHPVPATAAEVDLEAGAVLAVGTAACPMRVVLERVIATSTGSILACWQLVEGSEPAGLRSQLAAALPHAPPAAVQAVRQPEILHTTLARVVKEPPGGAAAVQRAVAAASHLLCGLETTVREIWYVEELDLLALALGGSFRTRQIPLRCSGKAQGRL